MSTEHNKDLVRSFIERAWNNGDLTAMEIYSPRFINHNPGASGPTREGFARAIEAFRAAFPDLHCAVDLLLAEGDFVTLRWTMRGTQHGPFLGITPTGRQATWTGINISRITDGEVVEAWNNMDMFGLLQQLNGAPAPAATRP